MQPLWDDLYAAGVDILLVGHDHIYERFAPMKSGATLAVRPSPTRRRHPPVHGRRTAAPAATALRRPCSDQRGRNDTTYGVMKFTLHASTYDWVFLPIAGSTFTDSGTGTVHGAPVTAPGAPTIGTATAGNAEATVTWTAPASNGGAAITGYVVTPYIGATAQSTTTVGDVTSTTITALTNGTAYTFRVAAINSVGPVRSRPPRIRSHRLLRIARPPRRPSTRRPTRRPGSARRRRSTWASPIRTRTR